MSFFAKIFVDNEERNLLNADYLFHKFKDPSGLPFTGPQGGEINIELESISRDNLWYDWMLSYDLMKKGYIRFYNRDGMSKLFDLEFWDCFCTNLHETFRSTGPVPMKMTLSLSAGIYRIRGLVFERSWKVSDPFSKSESTEEAQKRRCLVTFSANKHDTDQGNFGFDYMRRNYKDICDNYQALKAEYTLFKINGDDYFVPWLSIRQGQTVTLKLDKTIKGDYECISLDHNAEEFTINAENLETVSEVQITCNALLTEPLLLKVMADGELAGALHVWQNRVRKVKLSWVFVEMQGGEKDKNALERKINSDQIKKYLHQAFNPALIEIELRTSKPEILNIPELPEHFLANIKKALKTRTTDEVASDEASKSKFFRCLYEAFMQQDCMILGPVIFFVNLICQDTLDEKTELRNGVTQTGEGLTMMFMKNRDLQLSGSIPHEVMHGLGLNHSFSDHSSLPRHTFKKGTTKNYMDYVTVQKSTWKWQWDLLSNSRFIE